MKKTLLVSAIATMLIIALALPAFANTFGDYAYKVLEDGSCEIKGWYGDSEDVDIHGDIEGHPITSIGANSFSCSRNLRIVWIEHHVRTIKDRAFAECKNLSDVQIMSMSSVTSIGEHCFSGCKHLYSIRIPASVTYIADNAFEGCPNVTIFAPEGSYAIEYAQANGIKWEYD